LRRAGRYRFDARADENVAVGTIPPLGKTEPVTDHRLPYELHLAALAHECDAIFDASGDALEAPVPTCPDWHLSDLVAHLGGVYTFWHTQLEAASPEARAEPASRGVTAGSDLLDWFADAGAGLQIALADRDPAEPCWNWSGADLTARWVCRRMALESAVHRFDAELAVDSPAVVDRDLAVDGMDEWLGVHLAADVPAAPGASLGGVLCLACADAPAAWTVEVAGGRLRYREGRGPADAVLVGPASDLYLFSWNRRPLDVLDLTGSREVAAAWSSLTS
jgi:uncharacterized protein (TIGR03083 family)